MFTFVCFVVGIGVMICWVLSVVLVLLIDAGSWGCCLVFLFGLF